MQFDLISYTCLRLFVPTNICCILGYVFCFPVLVLWDIAVDFGEFITMYIVAKFICFCESKAPISFVIPWDMFPCICCWFICDPPIQSHCNLLEINCHIFVTAIFLFSASNLCIHMLEHLYISFLYTFVALWVSWHWFETCNSAKYIHKFMYIYIHTHSCVYICTAALCITCCTLSCFFVLHCWLPCDFVCTAYPMLLHFITILCVTALVCPDPCCMLCYHLMNPVFLSVFFVFCTLMCLPLITVSMLCWPCLSYPCLPCCLAVFCLELPCTCVYCVLAS